MYMCTHITKSVDTFMHVKVRGVALMEFMNIKG